MEKYHEQIVYMWDRLCNEDPHHAVLIFINMQLRTGKINDKSNE